MAKKKAKVRIAGVIRAHYTLSLENGRSGVEKRFYEPRRPFRPYVRMKDWSRQVSKTLIITLFLLLSPLLAGAETIITEASYFTRASCLKEGTSGIMANGKELNDERKIAASWDYSFGTLLHVTNLANGRSVVCSVEDRGPNRKLYRMGRRLDLSKAAMRELDGIKQGLIQVRIEVIK